MKRRKLNTNKVMGILFFFLLLTLGTCFFLKSDFFYLKEVVINNNKSNFFKISLLYIQTPYIIPIIEPIKPIIQNNLTMSCSLQPSFSKVW